MHLLANVFKPAACFVKLLAQLRSRAAVTLSGLLGGLPGCLGSGGIKLGGACLCDGNIRVGTHTGQFGL